MQQKAPIPTQTILESITDGVFTVDLRWRVTSFNRSAERITGISREDAVGRRCAEVFKASLCEGGCPLKATLESGRAVVSRAGFIVDVHGRRVPISVSTALLKDEQGRVVGGAETFRDLTLEEELRRELRGRHRVGDLLSRSPSMVRIFDVLPAIAESSSTVLIQGETGTGKELLARAIHQTGPRQDGPLAAVNCSAFPETLLESELFGYRKGAFTGATRDRPGRLVAAHGGTLFLDEVGEMSPAMQVKLLRVLQDMTFEPLGGGSSVTVDARVVCATNRDLSNEVRQGRFREDLYYRLNVVRLELPPLRARREDIPLLVDHFVARFNHLKGKQLQGPDARAMELLMAHDWPGNIRELENSIEHAFVLCGEGTIRGEHLPEALAPRRSAPGGSGRSLGEVVRAAELEAIEEAIRRNGGDRDAAAEELGIHRSTLFRKLKGASAIG